MWSLVSLEVESGALVLCSACHFQISLHRCKLAIQFASGIGSNCVSRFDQEGSLSDRLIGSLSFGELYAPKRQITNKIARVGDDESMSTMRMKRFPNQKRKNSMVHSCAFGAFHWPLFLVISSLDLASH